MIKKSQKIEQIMKINLNSTSRSEVLTRVENFISHNRKFYIVTPNPELILMAQKNKLLKNALNSADISVPDGVGLKLAVPNLQIIKGRELFLKLIDLASREKWKVFLLGGLGNEAQKAAKALIKRYPGLLIESNRGLVLTDSAQPKTKLDTVLQKEVCDRINQFSPNLLFVAFGNPKQEIWIAKNLPKLKIGGAMAVGGTLRYVAGISKLPPVWMAKLGLEWLWRLATEPKRVGRIFRAVVVFPLRVFIDKIS